VSGKTPATLARRSCTHLDAIRTPPYYTGRVSAYLFAVSYATMVLAGLAIGGLFSLLHLTPTNRAITVFQTTISWNSDAFLDIAFLLLIAVLAVRFLRTGGIEMLRMTGQKPGATTQTHAHD
jgi:hypothetical protein